MTLAANVHAARFGGEPEQLDFRPDTSSWPPDRLAGTGWTDEDCARLFPRLSTASPLRRAAKKPKKPARASSRSRYQAALATAVGEPLPYSRDTRFVEHARVEHPAFGLGIVIAVRSDRVDVIFPGDRTRVLLHKR